MLLLDTETLDPSERADAFQAAVSGASSSNLVRFEDPAAVRARLDLFDFGLGRVFNVRATGNTLLRTQKIARGATEQAIALALPVSGQNRLRWDREERLLGPRDMLLVDLASPYEYGWHRTGSSYAFQVDFDRLGLGMDTIRAAWPRLDATPLYPVVRDHILHVTTRAEKLSADPAASQLAAATVDMMRALIVSAAQDQRLLGDALATSLVPRILAYARHHLTEDDLAPARIAAAHNISVRYLYKLLEKEGIGLEQWIIERRLEGAHTDLASPAGRARPIESVARAWGFGDPSFFSRRFRRAYGITPRQWQQRMPPHTDPAARHR
jgi:AraC-like DNA-binding protein